MSDCPICHGMSWLRPPNGGPAIECECLLRRRAEKRARELREASGVSDAVYERLTFEAFDPRKTVAPKCDMYGIKAACVEFAAQPSGSLLLAGAYGTGKTHLAYAIAGELLRRSEPVYAASMPEMLTTIRNGFNDAQGYSAEQRIRALRTVSVLVLDDWGTEKGSDWVSETMFSVLNARYNDRLPTVVTTNLSPAELTRKDGRLASRLLDKALSRVLVLAAGDYRGGH